MIHLAEIRRKKKYYPPDKFPFNLPVIKNLPDMDFSHEVTFLVGENGSGKSTLLEALAVAVGSITIGTENIQKDRNMSSARELADYLRLSWKHRTRKGFFLRAEDFFQFAKRMKNIVHEMDTDIQSYEERFSGYGLMLAKGAAEEQRAQIVSRYGEDFDQNSHGESFIKLFHQRIVPGGIYLLDEPEAPLSPLRQIGFLSILREMVLEKECQFIIATHSPILMAYPEATIYNFDENPLAKIDYDNLEHVNITRNFLNNPESYLRHL